MDKFTTLEGVAAPLRMINVDTDMIIPKQYLKTIKRTGLGTGLFSEKRYRDDGSENPDFVLNKSAYRKAKVLVAGDNFGCGSSREHAVWALQDHGFRAVIAPSFADIFHGNALGCGLLPVSLAEHEVRALLDLAVEEPGVECIVDLEDCTVTAGDLRFDFDLDQTKRRMLLDGLDDIALTMHTLGDISTFEATRPAWMPNMSRGEQTA